MPSKKLFILIFVVAAVILFAAMFFTPKTSPSKDTTKPTGQTKSHASNKTSIIEVNDAGGRKITSADNTYSLTVPQGWFYDAAKDKNSNNASLRSLAPSRELLSPGIISFYVMPNQCVSGPPTKGTQSQSFSFTAVTLGGVNGYREEQVDGPESATPNWRYITYKFCKANNGYFAGYTQRPQEPDNAAQFDALVQSWKF